MAAPLSHGIKHWHWRTKGVEPWAKEWFSTNLVGTEANGVAVDEVTDTEGDCELGSASSFLLCRGHVRFDGRQYAALQTAASRAADLIFVPAPS